jgi:RND family efflux transporter MFP subunit
MKRAAFLLVIFGAPLLYSTGCSRSTGATPGTASAPKVDVSKPEKMDVAEVVEFTGRTQTLNHVDLKARVTGYLDIVCVGDDANPNTAEGMHKIKEGGEVKKGDVLFVVDKKPFEMTLAQAQANLEQMKQQRDYNRRAYERNAGAGGAVPSDTKDQTYAAWQTAENQVKSLGEALRIAQQNLDWATIKAPFDGRISKRMIDRGNDITADVSVLASIEQIDPLYAYFDVDERTLLRIRELFPDGTIPADVGTKVPLTLGLANEKPEHFSHRGTLAVLNNLVDPTTGTLRMWGTFDNPKHELRSGMFVRVEMQIGEPKPALFVAESALNSDQGTSFLWVLGKDSTKVERRDVERGPRKNGLIAVSPTSASGSGLKEGDRVVVSGQQTVRKDTEVQPTEVAMPRASKDGSNQR